MLASGRPQSHKGSLWYGGPCLLPTTLNNTVLCTLSGCRGKRPDCRVRDLEAILDSGRKNKQKGGWDLECPLSSPTRPWWSVHRVFRTRIRSLPTG